MTIQVIINLRAIWYSWAVVGETEPVAVLVWYRIVWACVTAVTNTIQVEIPKVCANMFLAVAIKAIESANNGGSIFWTIQASALGLALLCEFYGAQFDRPDRIASAVIGGLGAESARLSMEKSLRVEDLVQNCAGVGIAHTSIGGIQAS